MAGRQKESALDLAKFVDKSIRVKLAGGREGALRRRLLARAARACWPPPPQVYMQPSGWPP